MTVRAKFKVSELTDLGAGQPKRIGGTFFHDAGIPDASRIIGPTGYNFLTLNCDNQSLLAQVAVGKVIVIDLSVEDGAPAIAPAPAPVPAQLIAVNDWPGKILQFGDFFSDENLWGLGNLTRGTYTGIGGTTFEQHIGVSQQLGPNGEGSARFTGKYATGNTEVKGFPAIYAGNRPGIQSDWINPGGFDIILPDGSVSQTYPSGKTPRSIFPLPLPLASLKSTVAYTHNETPTGRGQATFDIWLQNTPDQKHGFDLDTVREITTEIMIPLDYWGGYGAYVSGGGGRNPSWYSHDDTIDGRSWHIFHAVPHDAANPSSFANNWHFVVFEPTAPGLQPGQVDIAAFVNYTINRGWTAAVPGIMAAATHCVSVEFGVEPVDGTYDLTVSNFRVFK